jgi:hypothetical protein
MSGSTTCAISTFGSDPAPNIHKECDAILPTSTPVVTATGTWTKIAADGANYTLSGLHQVRYGSGTAWFVTQDSGAGQCSTTYFGIDPAPNTYKECQVFTPAATTVATAAPGGGPKIDVSKIPTGYPGANVNQVTTSSLALTPDSIGAARFGCPFSHMAFDDPLVYPGLPGAAHLHAFFGNTGTNAYSTQTSVSTTGNSTCVGGTFNRTAYWVPAMIDTKDGTPVAPSGSIMYYKTGYNGIAPASVKALPQGLRMIAGDPKNSAPSGPFVYSCLNGGENLGKSSTFLNCPVGAQMWMSIDFPQCWDGVNLDSPDHKSHMAYPSNGACPKDHPVALPVVTFNIIYNIKEANTPLRWRLSSDSYDASLPPGYSAHGDWFNGWDAATMNTFITNCLDKSLDCHGSLLGDGRMLY